MFTDVNDLQVKRGFSLWANGHLTIDVVESAQWLGTRFKFTGQQMDWTFTFDKWGCGVNDCLALCNEAKQMVKNIVKRATKGLSTFDTQAQPSKALGQCALLKEGCPPTLAWDISAAAVSYALYYDQMVRLTLLTSQQLTIHWWICSEVSCSTFSTSSQTFYWTYLIILYGCHFYLSLPLHCHSPTLVYSFYLHHIHTDSTHIVCNSSGTHRSESGFTYIPFISCQHEIQSDFKWFK